MKRVLLVVLLGLLAVPLGAQALLERDLQEVSLDRAYLAQLDTACTLRVPTRGMTDQMQSGRCWLFSTLNILRAEAMQAHPELGEFYFSFVYCQYWDVYEKSARWLDAASRHSREGLRSRMNDHLFKKPIGDGGHWLNAAHLIDKYGLVPLDVMPEVWSGTHNKTLMRTVLTILRRYGIRFRETPRREHPAIREAALADVRKVLDALLGVPPQEFTWQGKSWTPASFRDCYVAHDMERDYAIFANDPSLPYYRVYAVDESRNCPERSNWTFLNLPADVIDSLGVASLRGGRMYYISADVTREGDDRLGVYDTRLHRYQDVLGVDLTMDKRAQAMAVESRSDHAVAVCGVRLSPDGKAEQWLIENSFGADRGWGGFVIMGAEWLDKYQWRCVVEKRFVPADLQKRLAARPRRLPAWYPLY
ncbi:MAG: hypothetical protein J5871_04835 [Bacteroidales bacterium]|nr:hypothetical protein [Bacteroidales bacterium]